MALQKNKKIVIAPERIDAVREKLKSLKLKNIRVARELDRSPAAVTLAMQGKRPILFQRIERYAHRMERYQSENIVVPVSQMQDANMKPESHE